jgi:hypothetical protein
LITVDVLVHPQTVGVRVRSEHEVAYRLCGWPISFAAPIWFVIDDSRDQTVAMPLLASGDQGWQKETMLKAILEAASHWLARGLPIRELKIVLRDQDEAAHLATLMEEFKKAVTPGKPALDKSDAYDVFLSFSSQDAEVAEKASEELRRRKKSIRIFDFRLAIDKGASWQNEIDSVISSCKAVVAILSRQYFESPECQEEIGQARLRNKRSSTPVLFPIYWSDIGIELALWLQAINYADCRERNYGHLSTTISRFPL